MNAISVVHSHAGNPPAVVPVALAIVACGAERQGASVISQSRCQERPMLGVAGLMSEDPPAITVAFKIAELAPGHREVG